MSALGSYLEVIDPHNNASDNIGKNGSNPMLWLKYMPSRLKQHGWIHTHQNINKIKKGKKTHTSKLRVQKGAIPKSM